jgi:hypothetical protein
MAVTAQVPVSSIIPLEKWSPTGQVLANVAFLALQDPHFLGTKKTGDDVARLANGNGTFTTVERFAGALGESLYASDRTPQRSAAFKSLTRLQVNGIDEAAFRDIAQLVAVMVNDPARDNTATPGQLRLASTTDATKLAADLHHRFNATPLVELATYLTGEKLVSEELANAAVGLVRSGRGNKAQANNVYDHTIASLAGANQEDKAMRDYLDAVIDRIWEGDGSASQVRLSVDFAALLVNANAELAERLTGPQRDRITATGFAPADATMLAAAPDALTAAIA